LSTEAGILEARDGRGRELLRALEGARGCVVMGGANVPGPAKFRSGLQSLLERGWRELAPAAGLRPVLWGVDALGPWFLAVSDRCAREVKAAAAAVEEAFPSGRLLDLDVYGPGGIQVGRADLALPPRACLLCAGSPAACARLGRHATEDLLGRVDALLAEARPRPGAVPAHRLAETLAQGALLELELTPKPGLVDRRDAGSHPDLTFDAMRRSALILPVYHDALLERCGEGLRACAAEGLEAEARMFLEAGSNAHKGYIFLSGLVLLAAVRCRGRLGDLPGAVAELAAEFFGGTAEGDTHGARARAEHGLGGIRAEALAGLPAVFERGWPAYRAALARGWDVERAAFRALAELMTTVEDTTAVRRGGLEGLARVRRDGESLAAILEAGGDPIPFLGALNRDYVARNLTMGGVADCLALTLALHLAAC